VATLAATVAVLLLAGRSANAMRDHVRDGVQRGRLGLGAPDIEGWDEVTAAASWIRDHSRADERLLGNLAPMYYLLTDRKAVRGFEENPFLLRYDQDGAGALGDADQMLAEMRRSRVALIVDSPDALYAERPHLKVLYGELERRGDILLADSVGRFRFFRPRIGAGLPEVPSPAPLSHGAEAAQPGK
jgi:hypothetical protein